MGIENLIFFDLDGTLISLSQSINDLELLRNNIIEIYNKNNFNVPTRSVLGLLEFAKSNDLSFKLEIEESIDNAELDWCKNAKLLINKEVLFKFIEEIGNPEVWGIITNNGRPCLNHFFNNFSFGNFRKDFTVTHSEVDKFKPSVEPYEYLLRKLNFDYVKHIYFVGDSLSDFCFLENICIKYRLKGMFFPIRNPLKLNNGIQINIEK